MTRLVKNNCWYINFFHFSKFFHKRKDLSKHFNIFKFKICLYLPSNFFIQIGVVAKPFEPVLWNFAWQNSRSCAFRWNKAKFFNIDTLCTIKVSFVTVDGRVTYTSGQKVSKISETIGVLVTHNIVMACACQSLDQGAEQVSQFFPVFLHLSFIMQIEPIPWD